MRAPSAPSPQRGLPFALAAYTIWGLLPLYMRQVHFAPPVEFVAWRILFTLPFCLVAIALSRTAPALLAALADRRLVGRLLVSAALIAGNWLVYVFAVQSGHVLATSIGYYLNPLANVLAGTVFLGERLSRRQWIAVGLAAAGVGALAWGARDTLWISLTLALSFSAYGLARKLAPVAALPALTIETLLLLIPAGATAAWFAGTPAGSSFGHALVPSLLLVAGGILTGLPLLLFGVAARRMDYSALGMVQFIAPSIVFLLSVFVFREPLRAVQLVCFALIWSAIAVFVWDLLGKARGQAPG